MDIGHRETDLLLDEMEKKVSKVYAEAVSDVQSKLDDYLRRFEIKDEKWRVMVANGEKTVEQYQQWRHGQMMMGYRWTALRDQLAEDMHNANLVARSIATGYMPEIYAINHNYATYLIEKELGIDTAYTLYDAQAVERILRDNPEILQPPTGKQIQKTFKEWDAYKAGEDIDLDPKKKKAFDKLLAEGKDVRWQEGQIQSVMTQGIMQGESIPNIAKRISRTMGEINHSATLRYARTAATGAQNAGRLDSYKRAADMGIKISQTWVATIDGRTRHEHRLMNGQTVGIDEPFKIDGEEIRFPGDPAAPGYLIWNCRCTTISQIKGFERDVTSQEFRHYPDDFDYDEWLKGHSKSERITKQEEIGEAMRRKTIREVYGGRG